MFSQKNKNKKLRLLPRLIVGFFMAIALAQAMITIGALSSPEMASAAGEKLVFTPQVKIGTMESITLGDSTRPIAEYIKAIYTYAVGAVGILATVMLMIGGLRWILAAGNPSSISEAKDIIMASISGMVLVLTSYLVLNQVNPALTDLSKNITTIKSVAKIEDAAAPTSCSWNVVDTTKAFSATGQIDACKEVGSNFVLIPSNIGKCDESSKTLNAKDKGPGKTPICCCSFNASSNCAWQQGKCGPDIVDKDGAFWNDDFPYKDEMGNEDKQVLFEKCGTSRGDNQFCCCAKQTFTPSGQCQKGSGSCSKENLSAFGDKAEQASAICQGESAGKPDIKSGTDICADGNSASWGLFQINISANPIDGLDCPSAFSGGAYTASNHNCRVVNQALYDQCTAAASDPTKNIKGAYIIFSNAGSKWNPWGFYHRACKTQF